MTKALRNSVTALVTFSAAAGMMFAGVAAAQQTFGGLPTVTPQGQAQMKQRQAAQQPSTKKVQKPPYVVVDHGGPSGGKGRPTYRSIQQAVNAVADGGVVLVMPGVYRENIELFRGVTLQGDRGSGAGVEIIPTDSSKPCLTFDPVNFNDHVMVSNITFRPGSVLNTDDVIDTGAGLVNAGSTARPCVDVRDGVFTMVESTVDGGRAHRGDLVSISGGTALLEKNKITGGRRGISVAQTHALWDRTLLIDNIVSDNFVEGVHLDGVASMLATGNLINANGRGLVYNGRGAATLVGNKILNNTSHGVLLEEDARQVLVRLNQIWSNKGDGIKIFNSGGLIEDNDIDGNMGYEISTVGHLDTVPTIINDVNENNPSPRKRRNGWAINGPADRDGR